MTEVQGDTVGDCLKRLIEQFPRLGNDIFDKQGKLSPYIDIYVDGQSIYSEGITKPVKDGNELSILFIVSGG
jgi:molybdopterin converting factor small subunit